MERTDPALRPLRGVRGPGRPAPRRPLPDAAIGALLTAAEMRLLVAHANHRDGIQDGQSAIVLQRAELDLLLVRLAADSGARRGELAALQLTDPDGRVLHIDRAISAGMITTPKAGRGRRITLGPHTADLWHQLVETWNPRCPSPPRPRRRRHHPARVLLRHPRHRHRCRRPH